MPQSALLALGSHAYYLPGGVNAGVLTDGEGRAILLDTGGDKAAGRALRRALDAASLTPVAIVNSHSHADHYGGNDYLARNLSLPVWAPAFEEAVLRYPYLEPMYLFGGAVPPAALRNKWLEARPSPVDHRFEAGEGPIEIAGFHLQRHDTSGHAVRQVAFGSGDVCFAADAFFGAEVLERYEIPFAHDVAGQLATLERLAGLPYRIFLPGHGTPTEAIGEAVAANRAAILRAADLVRDGVGSGATTSTVVHQVTSRLQRPPESLTTYCLMHSTLLAYLSYLVARDEIAPEIAGGALHWRPV